jgi:hypothetical protein
MTEKKRNGAKIARAAIDQRRLSVAKSEFQIIGSLIQRCRSTPRQVARIVSC